MTNCPCHSKKAYAKCCEPYHQGKPAEDALRLMRSRYAAYALALADYILETNYPKGGADSKDRILQFSHSTLFEDLQILEFVDGETSATVTFRAGLRQGRKDVSFTEKSRFRKVNGRWLYEGGEIG